MALTPSIHIDDQPPLTVGRVVRIVLDGIRYRLFRSLVTVAVIAVAVAFLANILAESLVKKAVARDSAQGIARLGLVHAWANRLTKEPTREMILARLTGDDPADPAPGEAAGLAQPTDALQNARQTQAFLAWTDGLTYDQRRTLFHQASGADRLDRLARPDGLEAFHKARAELPALQFPLPEAGIRGLAQAWPALRSILHKVHMSYAERVARVTEARAGRPILDALTDADGSFGETVRAAGLTMDAATTCPAVAEQARSLLAERFLEKSLNSRHTRRALAQRFNILPGDVTVVMLWDLIRKPRRAAWYLERLQEAGLRHDGLTAEKLAAIARSRETATRLHAAARETRGMGSGWLGLGDRMLWLLAVSLLVCGIGICNAMLMSVTERFREIATLKCLGALDGTIMLMFVIESCIQGLVGGLIGALLGCLIGAGRMTVILGFSFASSIPVMSLIQAGLAAVGLGIVLAAVAAIYPSYQAARLLPMEAMRIE